MFIDFQFQFWNSDTFFTNNYSFYIFKKKFSLSKSISNTPGHVYMTSKIWIIVLSMIKNIKDFSIGHKD